uniref:Putative secreted protein n=1 Tax=Anopheles darlingi TaxID=43151 RepID=A0A2M4DSE5_ANODA
MLPSTAYLVPVLLLVVMSMILVSSAFLSEPLPIASIVLRNTRLPPLTARLMVHVSQINFIFLLCTVHL